MEIKQVKHSYLNQNGYNKNSLTKERIGTLFRGAYVKWQNF